MLLQPLRHARLLLGVKPHPFFGTTPDGIFKAANPLVLNQVAQLGLVQLVAEMFTQIGKRFRVAQEQLGIAAVGAGVVARHPFGNEREATAQLRGVIVAVSANISAGQHCLFGPRRANTFVVRRQFFQRVLGQLAVGSQLAAKHRQQRCLTVNVVNIERIVAGDGLR